MTELFVWTIPLTNPFKAKYYTCYKCIQSLGIYSMSTVRTIIVQEFRLFQQLVLRLRNLNSFDVNMKGP